MARKGRHYGEAHPTARATGPRPQSPTGLLQTSLRLMPELHATLTSAAEAVDLSTSAFIAELLKAVEITTEIDPKTNAEIKTVRVAWSGQAPAALPLSA